MDAAHVGSFEHVVFNTPFVVRPKIISWPMPKQYSSHPEAGDLAKETNVWLVQNSDKRYSGAVCAAYNFEGYPDDESLVAGCSIKTYPHTAIGRHGNFLQWGYGEPPSNMTQDGRALFVNCICYIKKFAGCTPQVRRTSWRMNRRWALHSRGFKLVDWEKKCEGRHDKLYTLCKDNIELLYGENGKSNTAVFLIDDDLKKLGIESNRRIDTLTRLIGLLPDSDSCKDTSRQKKEAKLAQKVLQRYTDEDFDTAQQWKLWLEVNRQRIYFTDFGGYKFRVMPEGYRPIIRSTTTEDIFWFPR